MKKCKYFTEEKKNAKKEIIIINRALKMCKWYQYGKKTILKAHKDLLKYIYEI